MRVHHINCISTCPLGGKLMDGRSESLRAKLACHCLVVENGNELILVDTGLGMRDVLNPRPRLSRFFLALLRPEFRAEMTAVRQLARMGLDPRAVKHIVLTHLDFDHAGGLDDFPNAAVHLLAAERDAATTRRTPLDRMRYRPLQWSSRSRWHVYRSGEGEPWFGFDCVRSLDEVPPEILLVPLVGHTHGHAGVAVQTEGRWLLQAGDAYFFHQEMDPARPRCTPGLRLYQWMMQKNAEARRWNQGRLRELAQTEADRVTVFCGHDPYEYERLAGRALGEPAPAPAGERAVGATAQFPDDGVFPPDWPL